MISNISNLFSIFGQFGGSYNSERQVDACNYCYARGEVTYAVYASVLLKVYYQYSIQNPNCLNIKQSVIYNIIIVINFCCSDFVRCIERNAWSCIDSDPGEFNILPIVCMYALRYLTLG